MASTCCTVSTCAFVQYVTAAIIIGSGESMPSPAEVLETIRFASSTGSPDALFFDPTQEALIVRDLRGQGSGPGQGPTSSTSPTPTSEWRIAMPRMESSEKLVRLLQRLLLERGALDTLVLHPRWPPRPGPAMPANSRVFDLRPGGRVVRKRADSGHRFERCLSMPFLLPQTGNVWHYYSTNVLYSTQYSDSKFQGL